MAYTPNNPLLDTIVMAVNSTGAASNGSKTYMVSPVRGRLIEAGFLVHSLVTSAMTFALATDDHLTSNTSGFANQITSTLGTFSSLIIFEGQTCSVLPPTNVFVNQGTAIQCTTSGGNNSTTAATVYAIIRRG